MAQTPNIWNASNFVFGLIYFLYLLKETNLPRSKYEEDVYINNHTSVWGSWWKDHQWGYKCCQQTIKNSYCTGVAGIEAAEAAVDLMRANVSRKATSEGIRKISSMLLFNMCC